jgi:hypothetical protein
MRHAKILISMVSSSFILCCGRNTHFNCMWYVSRLYVTQSAATNLRHQQEQEVEQNIPLQCLYCEAVLACNREVRDIAEPRLSFRKIIR